MSVFSAREYSKQLESDDHPNSDSKDVIELIVLHETGCCYTETSYPCMI